MLRELTERRAYLGALALLVFGVSACGGQDILVDSGRGEPRTGGVREGVAGRVTAPDGSPVVDALIQPRSRGFPGHPVPDIAILTNHDGWYQWRLLPGTYDISVSARGYRTVTKRLTVARGEVVTLDFTLERAP